MVEIVSLIKLRDNSLYETSKIILSQIEGALNKALQYYMKDGRHINWISIDLIGNDAFVFIRGETKAQLGEIINNGVQKITVDEDYLKLNPVCDVQLLLPSSVVEHGDSEEIFNHIKVFYDLRQLLSRDDIINLIYTLRIDTLADITSSVLDQLTKPEEFEGFRISELTDPQIIQLKYFHETGSKVKN